MVVLWVFVVSVIFVGTRKAGLVADHLPGLLPKLYDLTLVYKELIRWVRIGLGFELFQWPGMTSLNAKNSSVRPDARQGRAR